MEHIVIEIATKELQALKDFTKVLREERDAIISFSLEGIIRGNNRKEEIIRKIEYLESEKERFIQEVTDPETIFNDEKWVSLSRKTMPVIKEINVALEKNMKLLSFSMDHVKGSIENILGFINKAAYMNKKRRISLFPSREI
ncbi:MAG: flagellar export chaperone FlgN [Proteobacteria bacterium]|nr:flagellar export chaperone FlgN [Pseudomonadota bacterium]